MEDQGKRLMLAVGIAFGIMLAWNALFPPEEVKKEDKKEVASESAAAEAKTASEVAPTKEEPSEPTKVVPRGPEQFFELEFETVRVRFSSYGASLASYELLLPRLENREKNQPENLVRVSSEQYRDLRVSFPDSTFDIPQDAEWKGEKLGEKQLRFTWESSDIRVVKDIVVHPAHYLMTMKVTLELVGAESAKQALSISLYSTEDPKASEPGMFDRVDRAWKAACYYDDEVHKKSSNSLAKKGEKKRTGEINWGGFDHAYFLSAAAFRDVSDRRIDCNSYPLDGIVGGMGVDMVQETVELKKGEPGLKSTMAIFLGPKYREALAAAHTEAGFDTKFKESVDLGFLGIIAGPLLSLLNFFQTFVINWGVAIILLTFVVKGLTLPWTHKSMKSMKAMSNLKPQLEKLKEKYKDDKARQNVETMNLFKAHKVNPMSGCLPMLLQMPIWFALYRALTVAGELYQAPFVSGWIDDLTLPDPYYVMPVLLTGMMFLQTRLTPSTGAGAQQKILMYGMPIMFGAFSFFFPSGLTLYIFTNTCFTALHHLYMHKTEAKKKVAVVATSGAEDVIDAVSEEVTTTPSETKAEPSKSNKPKKKKSGSGKKKRKR